MENHESFEVVLDLARQLINDTDGVEGDDFPLADFLQEAVDMTEDLVVNHLESLEEILSQKSRSHIDTASDILDHDLEDIVRNILGSEAGSGVTLTSDVALAMTINYARDNILSDEQAVDDVLKEQRQIQQRAVEDLTIFYADIRDDLRRSMSTVKVFGS